MLIRYHTLVTDKRPMIAHILDLAKKHGEIIIVGTDGFPMSSWGHSGHIRGEPYRPGEYVHATEKTMGTPNP